MKLSLTVTAALRYAFKDKAHIGGWLYSPSYTRGRPAAKLIELGFAIRDADNYLQLTQTALDKRVELGFAIQD